MRWARARGLVVTSVALALLTATAADARVRRTRPVGDYGNGGVPYLDVKGSCLDAQKFSSGVDKNLAFKGCMQDETSAKAELDKRWATFKGKDRSNCVEQARFPSPSYVEVLTCLEMSSDAMRSAPRFGGTPVPQVGGPVAPGLASPKAPSSTMGPPPPPSDTSAPKP